MHPRNTFDHDQISSITNPAAAGVLVFCETTQEFLLMKRHPRAKAYASTWAIPAGEIQVETLESVDNCARREFEEETTIAIPDSVQLWCIDRYLTEDNRVFFLFIWKVQKKFFVRLNSEHTEVGWFTHDSLPTPITSQVADAIHRVSSL